MRLPPKRLRLAITLTIVAIVVATFGVLTREVATPAVPWLAAQVGHRQPQTGINLYHLSTPPADWYREARAWATTHGYQARVMGSPPSEISILDEWGQSVLTVYAGKVDLHEFGGRSYGIHIHSDPNATTILHHPPRTLWSGLYYRLRHL